MIRVYRTPGILVLKGHAGAAPKGEDLVCAAVSVLTETLRATLFPKESILEEGFAAFRFAEPCPEAEFVCRGLRLLEKAYPDCIRFQNGNR